MVLILLEDNEMTTFSKQDLLLKFGLVKNVIAKTSTLNHLMMLNIRVNKNKYKLTGSNGEIQVTVTGECSGDAAFNVCVQPGTFSIMLGAAKNDIDITMKGELLSTVSARSKFNIQTTDGTLYPLLKMDGETNNFNLKPLLESVYKASPKKDVRPYLVGTCLDIKGNIINAVATDGSALFANSEPIEEPDCKVIIPNLSAEYLATNDTDGFIVNNGSLKAVSKANNIEVICKLVDAQFPDWKKVLFNCDKSFTVNRDELIKSVSTINKAEGIISVGLKSTGDTLIITGSNGGASISNEIEFSGDEVDCSMSPHKLLLCLQSVDCEQIEIGFVVGKGIQSKNGSHIFVLAGFKK